jgi:hypothetical protein
MAQTMSESGIRQSGDHHLHRLIRTAVQVAESDPRFSTVHPDAWRPGDLTVSGSPVLELPA